MPIASQKSRNALRSQPSENDLAIAWPRTKTPPPDGFRRPDPGPRAAGGPVADDHCPDAADGLFCRPGGHVAGNDHVPIRILGWFSPAAVSGIAICDAQHETVLEADRLTCDRSLLQLLGNPSNSARCGSSGRGSTCS